MESILSLPPQQFLAALAELQLDPAREAMLVEQYNAANAPQQGGRERGMLRNLLDNIIGFDDEVVTPGERLGAGVERFASGLLSDPVGTAGDILQGGYETIERAMAPGATPMDVMGAAGMAMGAGGLLARPAGSVGMGGRVYHGGPKTVTTPEARPDPEGLLPGFSVARTPEVADMYARQRGGGVVSEFEIDPQRLNDIGEMEYYDLVADLENRLGFDEGDLPESVILEELQNRGINAISYPDEEFGMRILDPSILRPVSNELSANRSTAAGLLASAAETPAQRVAGLLREGRASEVTDDLMAQADPQEMYRLYVAGETGADMPMDFESRMARARGMGFDTELPLYHGTGADFQRFDPARFQQSDFGTGGAGVYSSESPGLAGAYADLVTRPSNDNANILPIVARRQEAYDTGGYRNINNYEQAREYSRRMQELGVDNVYYRDNMSGEIVENVTFDPRNIRSRFARFDPRLSHLANLNAANVSPITGAAAVTASQQDDPLANLRAYISASGGILPR